MQTCDYSMLIDCDISNSLNCSTANFSTLSVSSFALTSVNVATVNASTSNASNVYCGNVSTIGITATLADLGDLVCSELNASTSNISNLNISNDDLVIGSGKIGGSPTFYFAHSDNFDGNSYAFKQGSGGTVILNSKSGTALNFRHGNVQQMTLTNGRLGIATTAPLAPIHVASGINVWVTWPSSGRRLEYNGVNVISAGSSLRGLSIIAQENIACKSVFVGEGLTYSSDRRIKQQIEDLDDGVALEQLRRIRPRTYKYKDMRKGDETVIGVIAQEVLEDCPLAHEYQARVIPNIQQVATVVGDIITFVNPIEWECDEDGSVFQQFDIYGSDMDKVFRVTCEILSDRTMRLLTTFDEDSGFHYHMVDGVQVIFVEGQYVTNFHCVRKEYLFTVGLAASQEIDRRQTADRLRIEALESMVASLLVRVEALES